MALSDDLWRDLDRMARMGASQTDLVTDAGTWVVLTYRLGRAVRDLPKPLRAPLLALGWPFQRLVEAVSGVLLPLEAEVGGGLYLSQPGKISIAPEARIGRDCNLSHGVVLAAGKSGAPWIGDRVYLGPGVKVLGQVRIGNDAAIAQNQLIDRDVPDGEVVGAVPARLLALRGGQKTPVLPGRRRPSWSDQLRGLARRALPRPTQLLLRS